MKRKTIFRVDEREINDEARIDQLIPSNPVWNYGVVENHPECKPEADDGYDSRGGKWLLFIPDAEYIEVFRQVARMTKRLELTDCFKSSGTPNNEKSHVFCVYCPDYRDIGYIRKIGERLAKEGFINRFGSGYKEKSIYFKPNNATHYESSGAGEKLTLFRLTDKGEMSVRKFDQEENSTWELIVKNDPKIVKSYEERLELISILKDSAEFDEDMK